MTPEEKRESHKNAQKKWLEQNREYQSKYREKNREKLRAYQKEWRANHPERVKELLHKYRTANRDKINLKQKERYKEHRDEHLAYYRKYNIEKGIENQRTDFLLDRQDDIRILMFEDIEDNRRIAEIDIVMEYSIKWYGEEI